MLVGPLWFVLWGTAACWQVWSGGYNYPLAVVFGFVAIVGTALVWFLDDLLADAAVLRGMSVDGTASGQARQFVGAWTVTSVSRFDRIPEEMTSHEFRRLGDDYLSQNRLRFVLFKNNTARVRGGAKTGAAAGRWMRPTCSRSKPLRASISNWLTTGGLLLHCPIEHLSLSVSDLTSMCGVELAYPSYRLTRRLQPTRRQKQRRAAEPESLGGGIDFPDEMRMGRSEGRLESAKTRRFV
jgi:hypothetical protein